MTIIDRLNAKKTELEKRLKGQYQGGSQGKEILQYKIEKIKELINAYGSTASPISLTNAKQILDQQVGFEEQKKDLLESLEIAEFWEPKGIKKNPLILCLAGPVGTGKTSFSQIIPQALRKKFFTVSLGGLSDSSILIGSEANSPANNMGQLAKALMETKTSDPVILLDEIDKTSPALKNCLVNVLDPIQNQEILDHFLEVKLDLSRATFIITTNDLNKIPDSLSDRMLVIKLPGYTANEKREIANKIVQKWFAENGSLDQNNFEITPDALKTLINKSKGKGVRNLKKGLDKIFNHCLLQWAREMKQGKTESKIAITPELVNEVIPFAFHNNDQENSENEAELEKIKKELIKLKGEKEKLSDTFSKDQNKLAKIKQKNKDLEGQVKSLEKKFDSLTQPITYGWWIGGIVGSLFIGFFFSHSLIKNRNKKL